MATSRTTTKKRGALASIGKKAKGTSKSETPIIRMTDADMLNLAHVVLDCKRREKEIAGERKIAEGQLHPMMAPLFEERCRKDGTLHTSIKASGTMEEAGETVTIQYTQPRVCLKMETDETLDQLEAVFGERFDEFLQEVPIINIDTTKLNADQTDALVTAMREALGESFDDAVEIDSTIQPRECFFGQRILNADVRALADKANTDGLCKLKSAYFKA